MRKIWVMSVLVLAGCAGGIGSQPWDKNHDGLVGQCEGLERLFCDMTPGCEGRSVACLAVCVDDGHGGCTNPCGDGFQCVPKTQPACQELNAQQCGSDPRCEATPPQYCSLVCADDGKGGCLPCNGGPVCHDRPSTPSCALVPLNSCAAIPACEVQTVTVCKGFSGVGVPVESGTKPELGCDDGNANACTSTQVCVNKTAKSCEETAADSCTSKPGCELQSGPVCEIACLTDAPCPPCAQPSLRCVSASTQVPVSQPPTR